jgi:SAM-dependent methyltransferase
MASAFDACQGDYEQLVSRSVAFSGLKHDFFLAAKVVELERIFAGHFGRQKPSLLDVGCGVGRMHPLLAPFVARLAGTDVSELSLARAAAENPEVDYRPGTAGASLPWENGSFDATLAVCVLHHVPVLERDGLISEMSRVTRPGGLVIIIEHNPLNPLTRLSVARCPFDADAVLLGRGEAEARLKKAGLSATTRHFLLLPSLRPIARRIGSAVSGLPLGAQYASVGVRPGSP